MKRTALAALAMALPFVAAAAPDTYVLDPYHTFPHFSVDHLGFSTNWGRFDKSAGKFTLDSATKSGSLELTVETASLTTGDNDRGARPRSRDEHLRSADFFNVAEFPRMTYQSTAVKFNGDTVAAVEGQLTLLGVTKPLTLTVERWKCGQNPFDKRAMCGGNASGSLKRSEFGMKYLVPAIGDEVKLYIEFEGYKQ